jgi:glycosyltransferase involved in cell wall biosynthesis
MPALSDHPVVSVIVPFFNAEKFLHEALSSVCNQTFIGWELLLVDDGSSDSSTAIATRFVHDYPQRVRLLAHPGRLNQGMSASRNLGIEHARGTFITFLDADDVWLPNKLERQVALAQEHPSAAAIYGPLTRWYSWTGSREDAGRDFVIDLGVACDRLHAPPAVLLAFLPNDAQVPSNALLRREAVMRTRGYEPGFRGLAEDQVFYSKLCLREPVYVSSESWVLYRQHSESCCVKLWNSGEYEAGKLAFFEWLERYLNSEGISDPRVWRMLRGQLWRLRYPKLHRLSRAMRVMSGFLYATQRQMN